MTMHKVDPSCTRAPEEQQALLSLLLPVVAGRCGFSEGGGHLQHGNQVVPGRRIRVPGAEEGWWKGGWQ